MSEAVAAVNHNNRKIEGRLYGEGQWWGRMANTDGSHSTAEGTFDLHLVWPDRLCFQTKGLGGKYFDTGCNEDECWFWLRYDEDHMTIGSRQAMSSAAASRGVPIEPDDIMHALGVQLIDADTTGIDGPRYRVDDNHHQLFYEAQAANSQMVITKEYWLSRYEPFLIERVLYRSIDGRIVMDARLSNHQTFMEGGPMVARRIEIDWPIDQCALRLDFNRRQLYSDVDKIEFIQPAERAKHDRRHRPPGETTRLEETP